MAIRTYLAIGSAAILTACASTPEEQTTMRAPVAAPAPVERAIPAPAQPIESAPVETYTDVAPFTGPVPGTLEEFAQVIGERVYFDTDQYALSARARDVLRGQAQWLTSYPSVKMIIEGHADERGTREYNLALGARRANAVKDYLVSLGVDPSRMTTISYGKERPVNPGSTESAWAQNRNGYTRLLMGGSS